MISPLNQGREVELTEMVRETVKMEEEHALDLTSDRSTSLRLARFAPSQTIVATPSPVDKPRNSAK